jgi:hypothetical protein
MVKKIYKRRTSSITLKTDIIPYSVNREMINYSWKPLHYEATCSEAKITCSWGLVIARSVTYWQRTPIPCKKRVTYNLQ